jgi:hypothetical protein
MPSFGLESWTLIGSDLRPVAEVDEYLAWLTHNERSPNPTDAYAFDLKVFWSYLAWTSVGVMETGESAARARALNGLEEVGRFRRTAVTDGRGQPAELWLREDEAA